MNKDTKRCELEENGQHQFDLRLIDVFVFALVRHIYSSKIRPCLGEQDLTLKILLLHAITQRAPAKSH
ncbi:hypothetical protein Nepgr_014037 [Nepenthes gracilis]|uniref:Uncharacterized protein n=1 Tax=Nepenthes gracilis TaxID=150966 RepID=A0AAD3XPX6_NEPGR|nr:hypothetical protein Nepgr_014037 [Nepenthes gracilis]